MNPWDKYQAPAEEGPWAKYGTAAPAAEAAPEQPASLADKMAGSWGGRVLQGVASPALAAAQVFGGEKGRAAVNELEAMKQRGMKAEGNGGLDAYGLLGSMLPGAGIAKGVSAVLPAAQSIGTRLLQGAGVGAATSAAQPVSEGEPSNFWTDKLKQIGVGAGTGAIFPAISSLFTSMAGKPSLNPIQAQTLAEGQQAGYVVPPSSVNPSFLNNRLESLAGKASVGQEAAKRNQDITNILAAKELGLPPDTSITEGVLRQVRKAAGKPYAEIGALSPEASDALDALKQAKFMGNKYMTFSDRSGDPSAYLKGQELKNEAGMIEKALENIATQHSRPDLVNQLPAARTAIAKAYDVERALNIGDSGISAPIIGRKFDKVGEKGMTGALATIGKMANAFPQSMREGARVPASGVSGTDAAASAILSTLGFGAGGPAGILAGGLPLLRGPARNLVLSPGYQQFATQGLSPHQQAMIDALTKYSAGAAGTAAGRNPGGY